jgi:hypothetical protein
MPSSEGGAGAVVRKSLPLEVLPAPIALCRLAPETELPRWAREPCSFVTVSRTPEELSIAIDQGRVPEAVRAERNYRLIRVGGPLPLHLIGVLASVAEPLALAGVPIFAISTYDTDYVLVKEIDLSRALVALERAGHRIRTPSASFP